MTQLTNMLHSGAAATTTSFQHACTHSSVMPVLPIHPCCCSCSLLDIHHSSLPVALGASRVLEEAAAGLCGCEGLAVRVGAACRCHIIQLALDLTVGEGLALYSTRDTSLQHNVSNKPLPSADRTLDFGVEVRGLACGPQE